ncbi:uncharacterized protein F4822DRAFT_415145 [Hypoxylon trugodes]|uniref:uncharacterized protein n=1 Tax=Hypoxylon trugodes TaxID=326681 RepID=UPI0021950E45|nr:uncharacterized protein F4822DRAFT_415145 [Hypoxylon trugodes]KAI1384430.1 hypothetical protein F4822DRAFT_415145 [Hypoxylon trugodes]
MDLMVKHMDQIYSNAQLTIIAAFGSSARDHLPGIGDKPVRCQRRAVIGETCLIEISNVGPDTVKSSKWATRGWTFQEGYLSKRRLVFTDNEVLFLCNERLRKETETSNSTNLNEFHSWVVPWESDSLWPHIKEYSKRDLSKDSDGLNAFLGVVKYYQLNKDRAKGQISHIRGIPLRMIEGQLRFDFLWRHPSIARRRDCLPSWSWSGWGGVCEIFSCEYDQLHTQPPPTEEHAAKTENPVVERIVRIHIPRRNGTVDLHTIIQEHQAGTFRDTDQKELRITSFVIPLRFRTVNTSQMYFPHLNGSPPRGPKTVLTFGVKPDVFLSCPVYFDKEYNPSVHKEGLVLPRKGKFYEKCEDYTIIVLEPTADGKYERAGILRLNYKAKYKSDRPGSGVVGRLVGEQASDSWAVYLDNGGGVRGYPRSYVQYGVPNDYFFLGGSEWKTICLV